MHNGVVKFWNDQLCYGFIRCEGFPEDIFVHFTAIKMSGHRMLEDNQKVEFKLVRTDKGLQAQDVRPLDSVSDIVPTPAPEPSA